ncbi:hypothetical protein EZJ49_06465 [Bdellovibrio bacteriovorus]|uniref:hypothetical protein n=1 Tax=Bdellovibrio bacteriovorus TaxID=959 RepID=UPI0021D2C210|nr:hypothetical protein [Bdellovibrio bacteriovorus]UXR65890.1 hypothetical protein EZJ49_06465 [Bdellovibrio bacteriovorus]
MRLQNIARMASAVLTVSSLWISQAEAKQAPTNKAEFCAMTTQDYRDLLMKKENHLAFVNEGGIGGQGVCWWHSMFTRNATYLAIYRPELPRPTRSEARQIIEDISANRGVVDIPGFRNLEEFSAAHRDQIQASLDAGQIVDGGILFGWVRGVTGNHEVHPQQLENMMNDLYSEVRSGRVAYQMLQIEGIMAHAWLVVDMERDGDGYILKVLDSNYRDVYKVYYKRGMKQLLDYDSVPYTSRNAVDYQGYKNAKASFCKRGMTAKDIRDQRSNR